MPPIATSVVVLASIFAVICASAAARPRHEMLMRGHGPYGEPRNPSHFYPHEIEGGVSGNLPFNNQIRKHVDPLNANGK